MDGDWGNLIQMTTISTGQESLRRNRVALTVNKRDWNIVLRCNLKNDRQNSVRFQGKPFSITVIQVYALTTDAKEAKVDWFYKDLQYLLELTQNKIPYPSQGIGTQK